MTVHTAERQEVSSTVFIVLESETSKTTDSWNEVAPPPAGPCLVQPHLTTGSKAPSVFLECCRDSVSPLCLLYVSAPCVVGVTASPFCLCSCAGEGKHHLGCLTVKARLIPRAPGGNQAQMTEASVTSAGLVLLLPFQQRA